MGLFSKKKNLVGLDIGSSSVKAVEMKPGKGETWQLTTIGLEYLPQEAIVDGQIMDSTSVIDAIQRLFSEYRIKTQDVAMIWPSTWPSALTTCHARWMSTFLMNVVAKRPPVIRKK